MNRITPERVITDDGSETFRHPVFGESYRSSRGAAGESSHVFIENGLAAVSGLLTHTLTAVSRQRVRILEVGFGSGLNALLTLRYAQQHGLKVDYTTIDAYMISPDAAAQTEYSEDEAFMEMHTIRCGVPQRISDHFTLTKFEEDFTQPHAQWERRLYDLVYFDAFAPDVQPEMWTPEMFSRLHGVMVPGGVLVTYSAKGTVKKALRESEFTVERLAGALGKHHMLRAIRIKQ